MCHYHGPPQLFLTFTCDDKAPSFQNAAGLGETWRDPVLFAIHLQKKGNRFFEIVRQQWGNRIGGITDWCYVVEIQGNANCVGL